MTVRPRVPHLAHSQHFAVAGGCFALLIIGTLRYPLPAWPLATAMVAYAAVLWRAPGLFAFVLAIIIPSLDLGLWTGWMMVGESDLFILVTVIVLLLRAPPSAADLCLAGAPGVVMSAFAACWVTAMLIGLLSSLGAAGSDNAFVRPDNALRLIKGLLEAYALLPFLRHRERCHGDAVTGLGYGLAAGLGVVTLIVLAERLLFASLWDFSTDYRVAGPFSSMRVGGGHIGAYAAFALPFCLTLFQVRPKWFALGAGTIACILGGYTVAVTFARAAYAASMIGILVTSLSWLWVIAGNFKQRRIPAAVIRIVPMALLLTGLTATAALTGMRARFSVSASDFLTRQDNWNAGRAVRDDNVAATLFGMGLGTYQRAMLMRSLINRPSDLSLHQDDTGPYVSMRIWTPFFLGQKITLPVAGNLHLTLWTRSSDGRATISVLICDKVLLYSDNCRGVDTRLIDPARWTTVEITLASQGLGGTALYGALRRPVELSLSGTIGHMIDVRDIRLTDDDGRSLLSNGNFSNGLDRWIFTDDSHVSWRMLNQYLMLFFETGILGLAAYGALAGFAIAGGFRAVQRHSITGAAVAGSVASFLFSGLFDNVLEAPRIATLFFLVCCCGLMQWEAPRDVAPDH